jgi:hypothetical protein
MEPPKLPMVAKATMTNATRQPALSSSNPARVLRPPD